MNAATGRQVAADMHKERGEVLKQRRQEELERWRSRVAQRFCTTLQSKQTLLAGGSQPFHAIFLADADGAGDGSASVEAFRAAVTGLGAGMGKKLQLGGKVSAHLAGLCLDPADETRVRYSALIAALHEQVRSHCACGAGSGICADGRCGWAVWVAVRVGGAM